ncbi:MAG: zinc ribbon domain-containing protein [Sedimentisphaerales bacterium]|nr:zinc ribbon domain-containing protein [Sedimentisphaerales bacterium]
MPLFEYECNKCGHKTEFLEKSDNKKKHVCEKCGSSDMQKVFSTFFAGSGSKSSSCPTGTCPLN